MIGQIFKITALAALGVYGVLGAFNPALFTFLNGTNILFHEAGHFFFSFAGEYVMVWGGTLLQLLFPLGLFIGFYMKRQPASATVMGWWFGQNFFGIAAYIKDARAQVLPFVGGEQHDWEFILRTHHILEYDQRIAAAVWIAGFVIMLVSVLYGMYASFFQNYLTKAEL